MHGALKFERRWLLLLKGDRCCYCDVLLLLLLLQRLQRLWMLKCVGQCRMFKRSMRMNPALGPGPVTRLDHLSLSGNTAPQEGHWLTKIFRRVFVRLRPVFIMQGLAAISGPDPKGRHWQGNLPNARSEDLSEL